MRSAAESTQQTAGGNVELAVAFVPVQVSEILHHRRAHTLVGSAGCAWLHTSVMASWSVAPRPWQGDTVGSAVHGSMAPWCLWSWPWQGDTVGSAVHNCKPVWP